MYKKKLILAIAFVAILGLLLLKGYPIVQGKLSFGNRINMAISIFYNGKQISMNEVEVSCKNPNDQPCDIEIQGSKYSVKGGAYGAYTYTITIPAKYMDNRNEDVAIELAYINANSWYISDSNCVITIEEQDGVSSCKCEVETKYNDGTSTDYLKGDEIENGVVQFTWGI